MPAKRRSSAKRAAAAEAKRAETTTVGEPEVLAPPPPPEAIVDARLDAAAPTAKKLTFRIVGMQHERLWLEKGHLPFFAFPYDYSLDPCANCGGHCCTTKVYVTTIEAMRLSLTLAIPFDDVVERQPADQPKGRSQTVPIVVDDGAWRLTLKKRDPESQKCIFFFEVGDRGRCGVHAIRPGVCRQFPYTTDVDDETISAGPPTPCPTRWLYNEATEKRVEADTRGWIADIDEEHRLIAAWDDSPADDRSWPAFTRFAVKQLATRFGKDARQLLAPPRRRRFSDPEPEREDW